MKKISGGCLCESVRFEVDGPFVRASHCHCSRCRKHSGGAGCLQARVRREHFQLLSGAEWIESFRPGDGATKAFCRRCGSSLFGGDWPNSVEVSIRFGAFDEDPGIRPEYHSFVDSRAAWDKIQDDLPQYPASPPRFRTPPAE